MTFDGLSIFVVYLVYLARLIWDAETRLSDGLMVKKSTCEFSFLQK